ncbi:uncharacterized protein PV09_07207 [Verruconis gallopava]|uniref:Uncharacterized protein n=1 Tax=Verruconis gallopava TaxID=253628 RepID=A0A0D2AQM2_9PEZI|nr:uncharacterized protein PV09_07207 [Verruconis gallopava]KIW01449.1 hypothetical protein PV09_07207 [Verruconis gallopava]
MALQENIIITGSNTGLGFWVARLLSDRPYHIILTSRTFEKAQNAAEQLKANSKGATFAAYFAAYELDVSSPDSVARFGERIRNSYGCIDVLLNNAGINNDPFNIVPADDLSTEATRKRFQLAQDIFATNVFGADALTYQILPLLKKSNNPRLIFITSALGSITLNLDPSNAWHGVTSYMYRASKAALNMTMTNWHKRLGAEGVSVWVVCPGWNATELGGLDPDKLRKAGASDPQVGAGIIVDVVLGKRKGEEGKVVSADAGRPIVHPC